MPAGFSAEDGLVVEVRGLRLYPGLGPGDGHRSYSEPSTAKIGSKRPRVHCLLRWSGHQCRSSPAVLAHDKWWCPPEDVFRVEWGSPAKGVFEERLTMEVFDAGCGDEDEDEGDGSLYDFSVSSVGSFKVPVGPEPSDGWYPCHSSDGSVLWGLFARVAVWPKRRAGEDEALAGSWVGEHGGLEADGPTRPSPAEGEGPSLSAMVDALGFAVEEEAREEFVHVESLARLRLTEQQLRWDRHKKVWSSGAALQQRWSGRDGPPAEVDVDERIATLRALVWDGIPHTVRKQAYGAICAAARKQDEACSVDVDYYLKLVAQTKGPSLGIIGSAATEEDAEEWVCVEGSDAVMTDWDVMPEISEAWGTNVAQEIELDIGRAFAGSGTMLATEAGKASLRRVLRAYALRNPVIGYCQGMNFIAGLMLLVADEETAFWVLCHMCEEVNPLCYSPSMLGTKADMQALVEILQDELPRLYDHCARLQLHLELWAAQWFLVYYINVFPPATALRIIEVAMTEGSDIVFAVAVAFLRLVQPLLLDCHDLAPLVEQLKARQATMHDADLLLAHTRRDLGRIRSRLRTLRAWHLGDVIRREPERGGGPGTRSSYGGGSRASNAALYAAGEDRRVKRLLARSLALGRRLLGLSQLWERSGVGTTIDRRAFDLTHRYLVERRVVGSITPYLIRALRWLMRWPIVSRRTGELVGSGGGGPGGGMGGGRGGSMRRRIEDGSGMASWVM